MRLQQKSLFRLLVDPFGRSARSLETVGTNLQMTRRGRAVEIPLQEVWAAPTVKHGMLVASLRIASEGNSEIYLTGAGKAEADAFAVAIREAWTRTNHDILDTQKSSLESVLSRISDLKAPGRYPAACAVTPLLEEARALSMSLSKVRLEALGKEAVVGTSRKLWGIPRLRAVSDLLRQSKSRSTSLNALGALDLPGKCGEHQLRNQEELSGCPPSAPMEQFGMIAWRRVCGSSCPHMELKMTKRPVTAKAPAEQVVKDIRRSTRKLHSSEENIRITFE